MPIKLPTLSPTALQAATDLKPLLGLSAVTLALMGGLYFFSLAPAQTHLSEVLSSYHTIRDTHTHNQVLQKTQEELGQIWKELPAQKDFTKLGVKIAKLARENHVDIPGMGYALEPIQKSFASKGALSFEAAGAYEDIRRFIYKIENSRPHIFIEKLTAERTKKLDRIAFKMTVGTFFKPQVLKAKAETSQ